MPGSLYSLRYSTWKYAPPADHIWYGFKGYVPNTPNKWPRCKNGAPFCQGDEYEHRKGYHGTIDSVYTVNYIQYRSFWLFNGQMVVCRECWRHIKYQRMYDIMMERAELHVPCRNR